MTPMDFKDNQESRMLAGLPSYEPDQQCSDRIRDRCHAALMAKRKQAEEAPARVVTLSWRLVVESAVVAFVCAAYLSEVVRRAMALYGF